MLSNTGLPVTGLPALDDYLADGYSQVRGMSSRFSATIAGHLMLRFGRIPRKGERWKGRFADFVIEDATPTAIRSVRMILRETKETGHRETKGPDHRAIGTSGDRKKR